MKRRIFFLFCIALTLIGMLILAANIRSSRVNAGQNMVVPIGLGGTLFGIKQVISEAPGTFILEGKNLVMLAWPEASTSYGFCVFSLQGRPIIDILGEMGWNSQKIGMMSMVNLYDWLTERGWIQVPVDVLPGVLVSSIRSYTVTVLQSGAQTLPTILVIPAGVFQLPPKS